MLQAGGSTLFTDQFSVYPVVVQDVYWAFDVLQSAPARVHGTLTVTIHPNNQTWNWYRAYLPFAANITAYELPMNRPLAVSTTNGTNPLIVDLGVPRSNGFSFILSFDVTTGLLTLDGWNTGNFAFTWQESGYGTFYDYIHPLRGQFKVTFPSGASFVDAVGINTLGLNQNLTLGLRPSIYFSLGLQPNQRLGWTLIYRDFTWKDSQQFIPANPVSQSGLGFISAQPIPFLPLTVGTLSLWTAVMSVFLLTGSELLSPMYARTGILINRRRLRIAAFVLVAIFMVATVYQIALSQAPAIAQAGR